MKILIDMNLSPDWVKEFKANNIEAVHWSEVGKFDAPDAAIITWARENSFIVFTHDLDFGTALALTNADSPSVIQVRTQNVNIPYLSKILIPNLKRHINLIEKGALLIIDDDKQRIRILPLS